MGRPSSGWRGASSAPGHPALHCRRRQGKAATSFQWGWPEPGCSSNTSPRDAGTTTEGRRIQGELKNLLEDAAVRRAESSASRRQGYPSEHRAATSRFMREASVQTGRTHNTAPAAPGRLGNEHHHHNRRAHLDERVHRGYHPRRGGRYDSGEDRSPSREPPGLQAFNRAIRRAPFPTGSEPRLPSQSTRGRQGRNCGSRTTNWLASWVERTMTTSSSATCPCSSPTPLGPGWSICLRGRSPTRTT
jgi:hypothetical protein